MKNNAKRMLSRKDAATVLGCSQQTVTNWVDNGTLKGHTINGRLFVDAETIHALTDTVAEIEESKRRLDELKAEYDRKREELDDMVNRKREELHFAKCSTASRVTLQAFVSVLESYRDNLPGKERDVLLEIVKYGDVDYTSQKFEIPAERVLKIADKACRRIARAGRINASDENDYLKRRVEELTKENERLVMFIRKGVGEVPEPRNPILDARIVSCDLSVKTINSLRCMGVDTVEQLTQTPMSEIMKYRNVGRKTVFEIEEFLKEHGLKQAK